MAPKSTYIVYHRTMSNCGRGRADRGRGNRPLIATLSLHTPKAPRERIIPGKKVHGAVKDVQKTSSIRILEGSGGWGANASPRKGVQSGDPVQRDGQ